MTEYDGIVTAIETSELAWSYPYYGEDASHNALISGLAWQYPYYEMEHKEVIRRSNSISQVSISFHPIQSHLRDVIRSKHTAYPFPLFEKVRKSFLHMVKQGILNASVVKVIDSDGEPIVDDIFYYGNFNIQNWLKMKGYTVIIGGNPSSISSATTMKKEELENTPYFDGHYVQVRVRARKRRNAQ